MIALQWITCKKTLNVFVRNRVEEIKRKASEFDFRYINTLENPADKLTRRICSQVLITDNCWWHGPTWLSRNSENWPKWNLQPFTPSMEHEYEEELVKEKLMLFHSTESHRSISISPYGDGMNIERYSKLSKVLRVCVLIEKAIEFMQGKRPVMTISPSDIQKRY